jgi:hypothetical protein
LIQSNWEYILNKTTDTLETSDFNLLKQWVSCKIKIDLKYQVRIGSKLLMIEV